MKKAGYLSKDFLLGCAAVWAVGYLVLTVSKILWRYYPTSRSSNGQKSVKDISHHLQWSVLDRFFCLY
jgi:hypothetical protein